MLDQMESNGTSVAHTVSRMRGLEWTRVLRCSFDTASIIDGNELCARHE
jgi:hypothetical protein